jgi:hypothetical protein
MMPKTLTLLALLASASSVWAQSYLMPYQPVMNAPSSVYLPAPVPQVGSAGYYSAPIATPAYGSHTAPVNAYVPAWSARPSPVATLPRPSPEQLGLAPTSDIPDVQQATSLRLNAEELGTMLPLTLPGYELRVMDVSKQVTFDVGNQPIVAEIPLFIYLPKAPRAVEDSTRELRKVYNDLIMLYDQERVDKDRIRGMLKRMDGIIDTFDAITPSVGKRSSSAN